MLSPDLIQTRRRGDELRLAPMSAADRERALDLSQEILLMLADLVGRSEEEVLLALLGIECLPKEAKLKEGLAKLALDGVRFEASTELLPVEIRRAVFQRAARARIECGPGFERGEVLSEVARDLGSSAEELERALFADLKGAAELREPPTLDAEALVQRYEEAQLLGVFLRAVRVRAALKLESPAHVRSLFRKLKFRELLFRLEEEAPGSYRLEVEGPSSLLVASTRYGLRLAQVIRALNAAGATRLEADVVWGKNKRPLTFRHVIAQVPDSQGEDVGSEVRDELRGLCESELIVTKGYRINQASRIFNVPGVGVCVPDLEFSAPGREPVYFELLGEGSRDAVFRRAEWASENPSLRIVFAAPQKLRVSPEIMDPAPAAALLVYKGSLSPKKVLEQVEALSGLASRANEGDP